MGAEYHPFEPSRWPEIQVESVTTRSHRLPRQQQAEEEDEVDYEEMGVAETYADYWPAKCKCLPTCSDYYYT